MFASLFDIQALQVDSARWAKISKRCADQSSPIHIVGLGRFGGNTALIEWLLEQGNSVIVWERQREEDYASERRSPIWNSSKLNIHWASEPELPLDDLIFLTAGIKPTSAFLTDIPPEHLSTEIEVSMALMAEQNMEVHVVTGSVGKSTCCSLLAKLLNTCVVGNIGRSILSESKPWPQRIVLELSSFQIHYLRFLKWKPSSMMLTPLAEHHSDWHGSVQAYQNCKLNAFNENSKHRPKTASTDASQPLESELALPGEHNLNNAELVLSHALKLNFKEQLNLEAFFSFKGLPHRLQLVHQTDALKCINDSKATSPGAVEQALKSLSGPITLILMGVPIDGWKELLPRFSTFDISYHLVGRMHDLKMIFQHHNPKLHEDLSSCLQYLAEQQIKGSILLSPGGPSYDQYNNYEERGEHFTQLCKRFFTEL